MADSKDYMLVRFEDGIDNNAVLAYDALRDMVVDSGVHADNGELTTAAGTVNVGLQEISSAGEQVIWRNKNSQVRYSPPWHIIDEINPGGSKDRFYEAMQTVSRFTIDSDILENPSFSIHVPKNEVVFRLHMDFPESRNDIEFKVTQNGFEMWREIRDVSAGDNVITLEIPIAFHTGDFVFSIKPYGKTGVPVKVRGNAQTGEVAYKVDLRYFEEKTLATKEYVHAAVSGGPSSDVMLKSVYDPNEDGKVNSAVEADSAIEVSGVQGTLPLHYYGKDIKGTVGFHKLPTTDVSHTAQLTQGDIPYWDDSDSQMKPSGLRKVAGDLLTGTSGFHVGEIGLVSDGTGLSIKPIHDTKVYRILKQVVAESSDVAYIRSYGDKQIHVVTTGFRSELKDPKTPFSATKDATVAALDIKLAKEAQQLKVECSDASGDILWSEDFTYLSAGDHTLTLNNPPDVLSGETLTLGFSGVSGSDNFVTLNGTSSVPYLRLHLIPWTENKIATEAYVSSGIEPIENSIQDVDHRVDNVDTTVSALAQRIGEFQRYFVYRGKIAPEYPSEPLAGYFSILYDLTKTEVVSLPKSSTIHDGAMFFLKNEDVTNTVRLEAPSGVSINGGTSITLPPQTALWLVHNKDNWLVMMSGYLPTSHAALISEIKSQVSGASLGITVDDGTTNYGDIKLLKLKGIDANRPAGDSIDSVTLSARTVWGTLGDAASNAKSSMVLTEPPLQSYSDPNADDTVRLRLEPGTFETVHAPGYLAYLNTRVDIVGKTHTATSHADGAIYPTDVVVDNGTYIVKDMKAKAIGLQEADQGDPNVTGGTDYLVAFRIALEGEAPADGFVEIYLAEKAEFGQPVKFLEDSNGHPLVSRRYYHLGDKMESLETIGIVNAKGLKEFTMHVVDSFNDKDISIAPRDIGISGIMVQALLPTSKSGLASVQYEVDTEQNIEFTRYYMSPEMTNIDWLTSYVMPLSEGTAGEGADFPDGLHLNNISTLMTGFVDNRMVFKGSGPEIVDFVFGKIEDAVPTYAMRGKTLAVKLVMTNKDAAFKVALMKWTGPANQYNQEIYVSRNNGEPAFQSGWTLVDSLFIPEDAVNDDHEVNAEFVVPSDANNYAVVIYPSDEKYPTELKLKTFNVGPKNPFYFYHLHQSRSLSESHLEYDDEYYESIQDATGLYSLRYTINNDVNGQAVPCGTRRKGKADITLDPTVNQIPGSSASGGEGALKFGKEGQATITTLLNIASEQPKGTTHPTSFWWVTVAADGSMREISGSRTTFPISGDSSGTYLMKTFTTKVEVGDRIALRAKSDMPDGAYLISIEGKVALVDISINFKELIASPTADDPFASLDLQQFDHVYTNSLTVTKDVGNTSSVTLPITIEDTDHLVVLGAVKQLPDNSIRPVRTLDWVYNNEDHTLKVSFGETILIGRITLGIYRD